MNFSRAFPAFSAAFCIVYLASMYFHPALTLFTYVPRTGAWLPWGVSGADLARNAPGMYWYSWLLTGLMAGVAAAVVSMVLPQNLKMRALVTLAAWIVIAGGFLAATGNLSTFFAGFANPAAMWWVLAPVALIAMVVATYFAAETTQARLWANVTWAAPVALIIVLTYIERTWFGFR